MHAMMELLHLKEKKEKPVQKKLFHPIVLTIHLTSEYDQRKKRLRSDFKDANE